MQTEILLFFSNISNPVLDFIANISSILGEQNVLIIIIAIVLYTYDKNKGFAICYSLVISLFTMGILKAIFKVPRPFQVLDEIKGKRIETATGYSFPSGHTMSASSLYASLSFAIKKRKLSIICAIIIVLVGLSRMYLGVHWPLDVAVSLILGISLSIIFYPMVEKIATDLEKKFKASLYLAIFSLVFSLSFSILLHLSLVDEVAFSDVMKTMAFSSGGFFGIAYETKKIGFKVDGTLVNKILRVIILIAGMLLIQLILSNIIPESIYYLGAFIRYNLIGLWLSAIFPKVFKKLFN